MSASPVNASSHPSKGAWGPLVLPYFDRKTNQKPKSKLYSFFQVLFSFDCFPNFSAKVRQAVYNPLGILILAAFASLLCGLGLHSQGLVLFAAITAVILLGLSWPWLNLRGLSGSIGFASERIEEGGEALVDLRVVNALPWTAWGLGVHGDWNRHHEESQVGLASAPGSRTLTCQWAIKPEIRGVYPTRGVTLSTGFPFGLWESRKTLQTRSRLVVWPKTFPVGPVPPVGGERLVEGNVSHAKVGSYGDVLGVRPYRRGDSPRRIHWAQSARHDRLIVCELQTNSRPVIQLVLDANPEVHRGEGLSGTWEWSIRIAASLARGWIEEGAQVGLAWDGGEIPPASGTRQIQKILDQLAIASCSAKDSIEKVLACPKCRGFRDGLQVIITTTQAHSHEGCQSCDSESHRWIVLDCDGFTHQAPTGKKPSAAAGKDWLTVHSPESVPGLLKGGWREARHGS